MGSASPLSLPGLQLQAGGNLWISGLTSSGKGLQGPAVRSHGLGLLTVQGPSCLRALCALWCTYRKHALWDQKACPRSCSHSSESPHPVTASVSNHLVSHGEHQADQGNRTSEPRQLEKPLWIRTCLWRVNRGQNEPKQLRN